MVDPLSDVLRLTEVTAHLSAGMTGRGRWSVSFDAPVGVKFNAVRAGHCVLRVDDTTIELHEGDCFLLTAPHPFQLATDPHAMPRRAGDVFATLDADGVAHVGADESGEPVTLIGGRFDFGARAHELIISALPGVVHVRADRPEAATVRSAIEAIDTELRSTAAGNGVIAESLAVVMLVRILRLLLDDAPHGLTGMLAGLRDPAVAAAISAMHERPEHAWSVAELAAVAAVSRSTLAARFTHTVGVGPLAYLTGWRMELAAHRLRHTDDALARIARDVGYGSDSAFSVAFTRVVGSSPSAYRRASVDAQAS
ncbi:AraC family transcriptional regulator [Gordonia sp. LSe1-13]|uniref:AraC family transcriptional regulator n=1 Tax=Gordonia sesuvii TaxID=3116777 RepID=A0ABU7MF71_9ACTN|nr:AraC family transcriptional regulator [Gordonia sp. LSe1-13]